MHEVITVFFFFSLLQVLPTVEIEIAVEPHRTKAAGEIVLKGVSQLKSSLTKGLQREVNVSYTECIGPSYDVIKIYGV